MKLHALAPAALLFAVASCTAAPLDPGPGAGLEPPTAEEPVASPPPAPPAAPIAPACSPAVPRTTPLEVSVLPGAEVTPFVSVLSRATKTIRVMVYQMGYGPILEARSTSTCSRCRSVTATFVSSKLSPSATQHEPSSSAWASRLSRRTSGSDYRMTFDPALGGRDYHSWRNGSYSLWIKKAKTADWRWFSVSWGDQGVSGWCSP